MGILTGINKLTNVLQKRKDTLWEYLGEVDTRRTIINSLRTNSGFTKVWDNAKLFAEKKKIMTPNLSHSADDMTGKRIRKKFFKKYKGFIFTGPDSVSMSIPKIL